MQAIPPCPITGLPATRLIHLISTKLIIGLWRGAFAVKTERQLAGIDHFGLWESPCGLAFFNPYPLRWWTDQTITGRFIGRHSEERKPIGFLGRPAANQ